MMKLVLFSMWLAPAATSLSPLITFSFSKSSEVTFTGKEAKECSDPMVGTGGSFGDIALVSTKSQGSCWTDGRYNGLDYKVEQGTITGSDGTSLAAYKFFPAAIAPENFQAGDKVVYVRFPTPPGAVKVYSFDGTSFALAQEMTVSTANEFVATKVKANELDTAGMIYVFTPASTRVSVWPLVGSAGIEGAVLASGAKYSLTARRFPVGTGLRPHIPESDWASSPNAHNANYGIPKQFWSVDRSDGKEGVLWQDYETRKVYMTWFTDMESAVTTECPELGSMYYLVAAASNGVDGMALIMMSPNKNSDKVTGLSVKAFLVHSSTGATTSSTTWNTNKDGGASMGVSSSKMNIWGYSSSGASMVWDKQSNKIGLALARTYSKASDGLNHQGGSAWVIDGSTLEVSSTAFVQTSGHSFRNSLVLASDNTFLGMDLGDNYPRGINVWRFDKDGKRLGNNVVYEFKTSHGKSAESPGGKTYPEYTEISSADQKYYKWSNDNNVYTELAHQGLVEVDDGILVFFAGEKQPLDNSKVGGKMNEPRNIGFVKIGKDITKKEIVSTGATETGGFYTFGGGWTEQENKGINFLTDYTSTDSCVSRAKTARLGQNNNVLMWEIWTKTAYVKSQAMVVDDAGAVVQQAFDTGYPMRLPYTDDMTVIGGKAVAYVGTMEGHIVRYEMSVGAQSGTTGAATSGTSGTATTGTTGATTGATASGTSGTATTGTTGATTGAATSGTSGTATTGTTGATTGGTTTQTITGSLQLTVANATDFVKDTVAKTAVEEGIAGVVGVPVDKVTVTFTVGGRRLTSRRLASSVKVDYTIAIPPSSSVSLTAATSALAAATTAELTTAIQNKVAAKSLSYTVTVTSKSSGSSSGATSATASGSSATGGKAASSSDAPSNNCFVVFVAWFVVFWRSSSSSSTTV